MESMKESVMKILTVIPMKKELDLFVQGCLEHGITTETSTLGRIPVTYAPSLDLIIGQGGLGKAQFAVQTQYLIDHTPDCEVVICAGAAGGLDDRLRIGDVVIGTKTIEYDIRNKFGKPLLPQFTSAKAIVEEFKRIKISSFNVYSGAIASGDEDIVNLERRREVRERTGALANGWEGAGGARASHFSGVSFIEIRGISDTANATAAHDFKKNLPLTMKNVASVIIAWARLKIKKIV
jgi:adenosylhomocysteine nucleosidase